MNADARRFAPGIKIFDFTPPHLMLGAALLWAIPPKGGPPGSPGCMIIYSTSMQSPSVLLWNQLQSPLTPLLSNLTSHFANSILSPLNLPLICSVSMWCTCVIISSPNPSNLTSQEFVTNLRLFTPLSTPLVNPISSLILSLDAPSCGLLLQSRNMLSLLRS